MKRILIATCLLILFIGAVAARAAGQANSKVKLVDEFDPRQGCETMERRLDLLFAEASHTPSTTAYVLIHQSDNVFDNAIVHRAAISYARYRGFPLERYEVILVRSSTDVRVELWIGTSGKTASAVASSLNLEIPNGVARTQVAEDILELVKIDGRETYIATGNPSCLYQFSPFVIFEILKANDQFEAELKIRTKSSARYKKLVAILRKEFQEMEGPIERLKFVYGGRDRDHEGGGSTLASVATSFVRKPSK